MGVCCCQEHASVCNNASWSIGEMAVRAGPEMHNPEFIALLMSYLIPIINKHDLVPSLLGKDVPLLCP